jgi:hypothetical protein
MPRGPPPRPGGNRVNRLRKAIRLRILDAVERPVPIADLRHDDRPVFVAEGYGGRAIEHFPPYRFYGLVAEGRREDAARHFAAWYHDQFQKYAQVAKKLGGMQGGTLYRLVAAVCAEAGMAFDGDASRAEAPLADAIARRVEQRIALFEDIQANGYQRERTTAILGIRRGALVYLTGGQHRAAALAVLGAREMPISAFAPDTLRRLKRAKIV